MLWHIEILHKPFFYCTTDQVWVTSICINFCRSYAPFWNLEILEIQSFLPFSLTCFEILSWNFTCLCYTVLQINFKCRQFTSIFVGVMRLLELRILEIHSFRTFLLRALTYWAEIFDMTFLIYYRSIRVSLLCFHLAPSPSIRFLHFPLTCIDKFSWNLKFNVCFLMCFF